MRSTILNISRKFARLRRLISEILGGSKQVYVWDRVSEYESIWRAAASEIGADFSVLDIGIFQIELDGVRLRIHNDVLPIDDPVTLEVAGRKPLVYELLRESDIPVPDHLVFELGDYDNACLFLDEHRSGVAVKPASGTSAGKGVTTHVLTGGEVKKASILASLFGRDLLVEPMIAGECFRLLVLDGKVVHAVCRQGIRLVGDGSTSVTGLIEVENAVRRKRGLPPLTMDRDVRFTLAAQQLSSDSVPARNRIFLCRGSATVGVGHAEVRTVYDAVVTDAVCESLKRTAEKAAGIIGSRFVGVDMITLDATVPLEQSGGVVNELNTTPGLHHHYNASEEKYPVPAVLALKSLFGKTE